MNHNETAGRVCANCGNALEGRRPHAIYCSRRCKNNAAHRRLYWLDVEASRAKDRAKNRRRAGATKAAILSKPGRWSRLWAKLIAVARFVGALPL